MCILCLFICGCTTGRREQGTTLYKSEAPKCEQLKSYTAEVQCKNDLIRQNILPYMGVVTQNEQEALLVDAEIDALHVNARKITKEEARLKIKKRAAELEARDQERQLETIAEILNDVPAPTVYRPVTTNCSGIGNSVSCTSW